MKHQGRDDYWRNHLWNSVKIDNSKEAYKRLFCQVFKLINVEHLRTDAITKWLIFVQILAWSSVEPLFSPH